ncbi:MAG: DUF4388 domain-containing protein [Acidobacteriota bacterium]|jgi:hypothetical protein
MALAGTLKDFSLADIFQLISLQRKTGYLTLRSESDVVTVTFLEGSVVGAESLHKRLEDRLGHVLVKSGRITREELGKALEIQKQTLQRLGYILVSEGFIDQESLKSALSVQMQQTVYRLFRWKDGEYNFETHDSVEFDRENVTPVAAESVLMEGIRMLDEWPLIEKKLPHFDVVLEKVPLPHPPVLETRQDLGGLEDVLSGGGEKEKKDEDTGGRVRLSQEEMSVYQHINGLFTVQEIIDRSGMSEFDTCKALFELINRQLVRSMMPSMEESSTPVRTLFSPSGLLSKLTFPLFWAWLLISVLLIPFHPLDHFPGPNTPATRDRSVIQTRILLHRVVRAIEIFRVRYGRLPDSLDELARLGVLPLSGIYDANGHQLIYQKTDNGYTLGAHDVHGEVPEDLMVYSSQSGD